MYEKVYSGNQQKRLLIGHGEAFLAKLDDVNEGGNCKSMHSELRFSNDWQVENKIDCSKSLNEANFKSLVEMPILFPYCVQMGLAQTQTLTNLQPHDPFAIPSRGRLVIYITIIKLS
jgi:hypothetical protein